MLNDKLFHLVAEFAGSLPGSLFKDTGKVGFLPIAQIITDLRYGLIGINELIFGLDKFACLYDLRDTFLPDVLADKIEVPRSHKELFCVKVDPFGPAKVFLEDLQKVFERGVLGFLQAGFIGSGLPSLRFDHREQGAEEMPDDTEFRSWLFGFL